jgi:hypothetical protein
MTADGCVFRSCGRGEALDLTSGSCVPRVGLAGLPSVLRAGVCPESTSPVVTGGRLACLDEEAACPRGTRLDSSSKRPVCARPPQCPPGTLPERTKGAGACRPIVSLGPDGRRSVDVGAWATLVLGVDGGPGTDDLCRPLFQHADVFGLQPHLPAPKPSADERVDAGDEGNEAEQERQAETGAVELLVWLTAPDQDIARVHARVERRRQRRPKTETDMDTDTETAPETAPETATGAGSSGPSGAEANRLATEAVETLLEPLRGLGGEANAAEAKVEVRCVPGAAAKGR